MCDSNGKRKPSAFRMGILETLEVVVGIQRDYFYLNPSKRIISYLQFIGDFKKLL